MAVLGGLLLWLLRLALAPPSTISRVPPLGARGMPRRPRPHRHRPAPRAPHHARPPPGRRSGRTGAAAASDRAAAGKQARMIALAGQRHDLAHLPLQQVSGIANTIGAEVDLSPGTARRVLLDHVRALQNGHNQPGGAR